MNDRVRVDAVLERATGIPKSSYPGVSDAALSETVAWLDSPAARRSLEADPYWPKWESPWWRMTLLFEIGLYDRIPPSIVDAMAAAIDNKYPKFFPVTDEEFPKGADPHRDIACHCALGTIAQVLTACDFAVGEELPWIRTWFRRYQQADGGWNCDDASYRKPEPHSSMVSTLPVLEALLRWSDRTADEDAVLDRGAQYLVQRGLCRSLSKGGRIIDTAWLMPAFPRFYHYDVLRGLSFLVRWAEQRERPLPCVSIAEAAEAVEGCRDRQGFITLRRRAFEGEATLRPDAVGSWRAKQPAGSFPLLDEVSRIGAPSRELTEAWSRVVSGLHRLRDGGRLS